MPEVTNCCRAAGFKPILILQPLSLHCFRNCGYLATFFKVSWFLEGGNSVLIRRTKWRKKQTCKMSFLLQIYIHHTISGECNLPIYLMQSSYLHGTQALWRRGIYSSNEWNGWQIVFWIQWAEHKYADLRLSYGLLDSWLL